MVVGVLEGLEWSILMLYSSRLEHPDVSLWSDASGSWGCGAVWNNRWFQLSWQEVPQFEKAPIATKELLPIVLAAALWGKEWGGLTVSSQFSQSDESSQFSQSDESMHSV